MKKRKGFFITFDGIDGCGKTTQIHLLEMKLKEKGYKVFTTREPGGTPISEKIRSILIDVNNKSMVKECESLLYLASRAQLMRELILPSLEEGIIVLCDRFSDATIAYQGYGRDIPLELLKKMDRFATGGRYPDLTFILDLSVDEAVRRLQKMGKKNDRLESEKRDFFEKVRNGYLTLAKEEPHRIHIFDAMSSVETISVNIFSIVEERLSINSKEGN
ncbi:MAG: dTMP kinase [Chitinispirillaceae bacterium]|nr:dTMP kinase [Chitinispirillaceae bacterium]